MLIKSENPSYIIDDDITIEVDCDAKFTINSNSAAITLNDCSIIGNIITFLPVYDNAVISYKNSSGNNTSITTEEFKILRFIWNGNGFILEKTIEISGTDDSGSSFSYQVVERK